MLRMAHNGRMAWTKLTSLPSKAEADLFAGRLRAEGIRSRINKVDRGPAGWLSAYGNPVGPVDIYVPIDDASAARKILAEVGPSHRGPGIHSSHRTLQLVGRGLLAIAILAIVITLLSAALR